MIVKMMEKRLEGRDAPESFTLIDCVESATVAHPEGTDRAQIELFTPGRPGVPARNAVYGIYAPIYFMNDEGKTIDSYFPAPKDLECPITNQADFEYQFRLEKVVTYNTDPSRSSGDGGAAGGAGGSGGTYILSMADPSGQVLFRRNVGALVTRIREQEAGSDDSSSEMHVLIPIVKRLLRNDVAMVTAWL